MRIRVHYPDCVPSRRMEGFVMGNADDLDTQPCDLVVDQRDDARRVLLIEGRVDLYRKLPPVLLPRRRCTSRTDCSALERGSERWRGATSGRQTVPSELLLIPSKEIDSISTCRQSRS